MSVLSALRAGLAGGLAAIALSGCGGDEEKSGNLAASLGRDTRVPPLEPVALEPPVRFSAKERNALSQLLQGNLGQVTQEEIRDVGRKLDAFAARSRANHERFRKAGRAYERAGLPEDTGASSAEQRLVAGYNRLVRALRAEAAANVAAVRETLVHDRRLILLARSAGHALADGRTAEYRSRLRRIAQAGPPSPDSASEAAKARAHRLARDVARIVRASPELRRLAARVERRYPESLFALVVSVYLR
jgi:hypothetical protein